MANKQSICLSAFSKRGKLRFSHWFPFLKIKESQNKVQKSSERTYIKIPPQDEISLLYGVRPLGEYEVR